MILAWVALLGLSGVTNSQDAGAKKRFASVKVFVDSGERELAAYQFELKVVRGSAKIVGVEGGEHAAYKEAPYYDTAAMAKDRIIIGAFNTAMELPKGRTRVSTVHMMIEGDAEPRYEVTLMTAGDGGGNEIAATVVLEKGEQR